MAVDVKEGVRNAEGSFSTYEDRILGNDSGKLAGMSTNESLSGSRQDIETMRRVKDNIIQALMYGSITDVQGVTVDEARFGFYDRKDVAHAKHMLMAFG